MIKRPIAQTIFRTVVFAGAMLGTACSKKPAPVAPTPPTTEPKPASTEAPPSSTPETTEDADKPDAETPDADKPEEEDQPRPRADAKDCHDRNKPGCFSGGLGFVVA